MMAGVQSRKLGQKRQKSIVDGLVAIVRAAFQDGKTGSLFGLEGPLRAALRADLCRRSWSWDDADAATRALLDEVFKKAGAERPDWNEGQLEWTIKAGSLIERTRCVRCHKVLPEERYKFCSDLCKRSHIYQMGRLRNATEEQAVYMAMQSI